MRISPLIQTTLFDVAEWEVDSEFAVFPQGARAKEAVFAPSDLYDPRIISGKRYLFKRSKRSYPDQFWGEIIAYRIGCLLGVNVPPAFAAYNSNTGHCAALIEWFYTDGVELFVLGGDLLKGIQPDFDRKHGAHHNLSDNSKLMRLFSQAKLAEFNWRQWWVNALLFDALIGNSDRHQDNWGLIFFDIGNKSKCKMSPLFDNGTSLGHERFPDKFNAWRAEDFDRYIRKGTHHMRLSLEPDQASILGHAELLASAVKLWPETRDEIIERLNFSEKDLTDALSDLVALNAPVPLTTDRIAFVLRLLARRHQNLMSMFT